MYSFTKTETNFLVKSKLKLKKIQFISNRLSSFPPMHSGLKEFFSVLGCNFFQISNTPLIPKLKKTQNLATAIFSALPSISNDFRCVKPPACD